MNKRSFLKTSAALAGGALLAPWACQTKSAPPSISNWAGNLQFTAQEVHFPETVAEVQALVRKVSKARALGTRHSFNTIADSPDNLITSNRLNRLVAIDKSAGTVTVESGVRYGEICQQLHDQGYALHNLASLPHISIAGSIATATHGSGVKNGNLATAARAIEFVNGRGEVVNLNRDHGDEFLGAVVGLGALGVVTKVTLDLQPTFDVAQTVYLNLPLDTLKEHFAEILSAGYSVSLFTDWTQPAINEVWVKQRVGTDITPAPKTLFGALPATVNMHPVAAQSAQPCTEQLGTPGPWHERLPHFKMGFMPSTGKELQAEYFVDIDRGYDAITAVAALGEKISPHLFISEIRTIAADTLWMSPNYQRPCLAIHTTWKQDPEVMDLIPQVEAALAPFNPTPHWAKLFTLPPEVLKARYARLNDFVSLVEKHDPDQKFRNPFLANSIFKAS